MKKSEPGLTGFKDDPDKKSLNHDSSDLRITGIREKIIAEIMRLLSW
jgi:hypothetical protein